VTILVDRLTPERRSWLMSRVGGKNTTPEIVVRKVAHSLGLRFRLHRKDLPGTPDLAFPKWRTAIFVHGCFWHRHPGCSKASTPKTRADYWRHKFESNVQRDKKNVKMLRKRGWLVLTVWECETKNVESLGAKLTQAFKKRVQFLSRATRV
jgi:DNA mismatch endonuclease (patch repair protein)